MTFTTRKAAAIAAAAALALSGATGVANAQDGSGSLSADSLGADSLGTGSGDSSGSEGSAGDGSVEDLGSIILDANATGQGSVDTAGSSLLGEPTSGSLSGSVSAVSGSVDVLTPADGAGSVDTTDSLMGEPTTGSLAPVWAPVAGSLGIGEGATLILGSGEGSLAGGTGSLVPVLMVGGSVATIAAGIYFAPQIHQALTDAGVQLPPLPQMPGQAPAPAPVPAPGPDTPNGRG